MSVFILMYFRSQIGETLIDMKDEREKRNNNKIII
jgi:hypothetical protein